MKVLVLHNTGDGMFWEYIPGKADLHHAHTFDIPDGDPNPQGLIFEITNIGTDYLDHHYALVIQDLHAQARNYRVRGNRSTSVGDVLVFLEGEGDGIAFACAKTGWEQIRLDLSTIDLSDIDNHLAMSFARQAHEALDRNNPPNPFSGMSA